MKPILFIQNGDTDAPGLFARVLRDLGATLEIVHAWQEEPVPQDPSAWGGIAVGGGAMSAYEWEEYPWLRDSSMLIRAAREQRVPVLGMCLGAQLMAGACGGRVFPNECKEIGFYGIQFTPEAAGDPLWSEHAGGFAPAHWHGDTFSLPPQAVLLASSERTRHQLFRLDELHYGLQFHLEIDEPVLTEMVVTDEDGLSREGVDPKLFLQEAASALPKVEPIARAVFTRWLQMTLPPPQ